MLTKKIISLLLSTFALLFSNTAKADFRKALDAYFERDGEVMMKEVMHAVEVGNTDGLSLFLSILEKDSVIQHSILFYFQSENREISHRIEAQYDERSISKTFSHQQDNYAPWVMLIGPDRHVLFLRLLEQASKKGTKTDQNRYLNIRYPYGFFKHSSSKEGAEYRKRIKALKLKDHPIKAALIKLSTRLAKSESKSEQKKLYKQLALTISKPNASYFYADITANMVNYYIKKNTRASFKQAYL